MPVNVYLAGPLFSTAEKRFNAALKAALIQLASDNEYVLPQEYGDSIAGHPDFLELAFQSCRDAVRNCDVVVAVLDGEDADSGTCIELGIAYANGKKLIGIRTDSRPGEDRGTNLMVARVLDHLLHMPDADVDALARAIVPLLERKP